MMGAYRGFTLERFKEALAAAGYTEDTNYVVDRSADGVYRIPPEAVVTPDAVLELVPEDEFAGSLVDLLRPRAVSFADLLRFHHQVAPYQLELLRKLAREVDDPTRCGELWNGATLWFASDLMWMVDVVLNEARVTDPARLLTGSHIVEVR